MSEKRLFHGVAQQIAQLIDSGVFPPGVRLPGERELAERFEVSRVTIREAEIALQAIGRIEIKTGSGVYVCEEQPADAARLPDVSAFELTEARALIESEAAALAAEHISDEALERLDTLVDAMSGPHDSPEAIDADEQFHQTIAEQSGNKAMLYTIKTLWRMRNELPAVRVPYEAVCALDSDYRVQEHMDILDALRARDPVSARMAMRQHFHRLIAAMLDATEKQALEEVRAHASKSRERFLSPSQPVN